MFCSKKIKLSSVSPVLSMGYINLKLFSLHVQVDICLISNKSFIVVYFFEVFGEKVGLITVVFNCLMNCVNLLLFVL